MDFVDATILRLADEASRDAVFDAVTLAQILAASHDTTGLVVDAPFTIVFDDVNFAYDDEPAVSLAGSWFTQGHTERTELALSAAGIGAPLPRIDLLFAGAVVATSQQSTGRIQTVELDWVDVAGIDGEINPLPTDPIVLEQRRRERLLARIKARMDQPASFDDAALGRWLVRLGVDSVSALFGQPQGAAGATLKVTFSDGVDGPARRLRFPFAAAVLVRDAPLSIAGLLDESRRIRPHLQRLGFGPATEPGARARRAPIVVWALPATLFDDVGWPGGTTGSAAERRAKRRQFASNWLARERIGLIVPPT